MYIVAKYHSFDRDMPMWVFETFEAATQFIKQEVEHELEIQAKQGNETAYGYDEDWSWAQISWHTAEFFDFIEWNIGNIVKEKINYE